MKKIFLTGASSGIGLATAKTLLARGHEVWGTSRNPARIPRLTGLHAVALELSDVASISACFRAALEDAGHFDVVINNAGSGHFGPAESLSNEMLRNQFQVLVFAQIELCRLALDAMRARGSGLIVNISSLAARLPIPFMAGYNSAKAAMASFTMTLQLELADSNIRIVDLQPGDIRTQFNDAMQKSGTEETRVARAWSVIDRNMQAAPAPELVARAIARLLEQTNPPPRLTVGSGSQAILAPLISRLLPQRLRLWGLRKYYELS